MIKEFIYCYSLVYWNFSGSNLQFSLCYQVSLIRRNIRVFVRDVGFHILRNDVTSKLTHKSISAQLQAESLFFSPLPENVFLISRYYHSAGRVRMQLLFLRLRIQGVNEPQSW